MSGVLVRVESEREEEIRSFFVVWSWPQRQSDPVAKKLLLLYLAFPDDEDVPPEFVQSIMVDRISLLVAAELRPPVLDIRLRLMGKLAVWIWVLVPKATMDEDHSARARKD